MQKTIKDVMTQDVITLPADASVTEACMTMRDGNVGDVVVTEDGNFVGILTDRDVVIRAIAEGQPPDATAIGEVASFDVTTLAPDDTIDAAVTLMRDRAVRRLPVVEGSRAVGFVSMSDLAVERQPDSALAEVSEAPANR
jgi:CBS domain-containing protein